MLSRAPGKSRLKALCSHCAEAEVIGGLNYTGSQGTRGALRPGTNQQVRILCLEK